MKTTGKIIKIIANFYYVHDNENKIWECFARARLLKEGKILRVGDLVEIESTNFKQAVIIDLKNRKNKIEKPPVANIDKVLVMFSSLEPELDLYNLDRYLSHVKNELPNDEITICINKIDLKKISLNEVYRNSGFKIYYVSALTKEGVEELTQYLSNKTTVLTGPSGVGKSSLIKAIAKDIEIKIGTISAIKQGKHITRNVELIPFNYQGKEGLLVDTPGFTQFSFAGLSPHKILATFNELQNIICTFENCLHSGEEGCALNNPINIKNIPQTRFESYLKILEETKSEIVYGTKKESKIKVIGGKETKKSKQIPKIERALRKVSRKTEKQKLLKIKTEIKNDLDE